jgi:hypothetical protein
MGGITLADARTARSHAPTLRLPRAGRHVDLRRPAQVRVHAEGGVGPVHRTKALRAADLATDNWLGGSTPPGSRHPEQRSIAGAWAVMQYSASRATCDSRAARDATEALVTGLRGMPGVRILGDPAVTLVAFTLDDADAFAVGAGARARWGLSSISKAAAEPALHRQRGARPVIPQFSDRSATRWPRCGARAPGAPRSAPTARSSDASRRDTGNGIVRRHAAHARARTAASRRLLRPRHGVLGAAGGRRHGHRHIDRQRVGEPGACRRRRRSRDTVRGRRHYQGA